LHGAWRDAPTATAVVAVVAVAAAAAYIAVVDHVHLQREFMSKANGAVLRCGSMQHAMQLILVSAAYDLHACA